MRMLVELSYESDWSRCEWLKLLRQWQNTFVELEVVTEPSRANLILVPLVTLAKRLPETVASLAHSDLYRENGDRFIVFDTSDQPLGLFPGVYASLHSALFRRSRHRTGPYFRSFNEHVGYSPPQEGMARYLFSFQGAHTSGIRARLFEQNWKRSDILVEKTKPFWDSIGSPTMDSFKREYVDIIHDSKFVLCPRGNGLSSFRLFETMEAGRVPVILADRWVEPSRVDWSACSVRVKERDLARLPEICESHLPRWRQMAQNARSEWEQWFSPIGLFRTIQASAYDILASKWPEMLNRLDWPIRSAFLSARAKGARIKGWLQRFAVGG